MLSTTTRTSFASSGGSKQPALSPRQLFRASLKDWPCPNQWPAALPALQELLEQFQPTSDDGSMLTVEELAEQLGISVPTVRRMVKSNQLPHVRIGRQIRFVPEDILASLRLK